MHLLAAVPPPLPAHTLLVFLTQLAVLLLLAVALGRLAQRLGMPAVVGELLTGLFIGPSVLGNLAPGVFGWLLPASPVQMSLLDGVAQFGVLLLVGVTGMHLDVGTLRRHRGTAVRISLAGLLLPLALGVLLGVVLARTIVRTDTDTGVFALFLGVAMCVSAIPVISKTLSDMNLLHRNVGQLTLAAGMVDDAIGWFLLSLVSAAATVGVTTGSVLLSLLSLVGLTLFGILAGGPVVRRVMRLGATGDHPGPTVSAAVLIVLIGAVAAHALHLEAVFGAFGAGVLIGTARRSDLARLAPLRTVVLAVLAPLFLATAGLRMDLSALADPSIALTAVSVLLVAISGKFAGAYLGARLSRLSSWEGLAIGAGMNARGVIEVIVAMTGLRLGVIDTAMFTVIVLVAVVTSVMAPPLLRIACARIDYSEEEREREAEHRMLTRYAPVSADS
ncbi:cation:proton antiporter [Micromonospora arborensis]|uniref:cation:proton antiporter n=1 Tax=Micromonospora arborensis TaxID=2116518 RepID=UPI00340D6CFB